ncbi:MAG: glycosyltransferase family 4 protein [Candidatus Omnitrophica bacterium]|nr:glycosyltransferase family 4 protein [Candidatus Omnitrophota bacterium]
MKILHLDTDDIDNPLSGGGSLRNYEVYRRLSSRHDITVLTASYPGSRPEVVRDKVRYIRLGRGGERFGLSYHLSYLSCLPWAIKKIPHDLLVEDFMPPCGGVGSFLWTKKPVIASIQWLFAKAWSEKYRLPFHVLERLALRKYNKFLVTSPYFKEEIRKVNSSARVEVVPLGIDEKFLSAPVEEGEYVLFMGRLDIEQKGLDILIRSYDESRNNHPYKLVIVGDGFDRNRLKKMVVARGLGSRVEFVGKITSFEDKCRWYSKARIVCMPSRFETFGLVALEAFAFGKPVLSFDIPALNELVTSQRGEVVSAFDEKNYAEKMSSMLIDSESLIEKGRACRAFASHSTWDEAAVRQESFFEECRKRGQNDI